MTSMIISLLLVGSIIMSVVASVGIHRLKDAYSRVHATSAMSTLGLICILIAALFYFSGDSASHNLRPLLTIVFVFVTVPAGTHILTRAAIVRGVKLWKVKGELSADEKRAIEAIQKESADRQAARNAAREAARKAAHKAAHKAAPKSRNGG